MVHSLYLKIRFTINISEDETRNPSPESSAASQLIFSPEMKPGHNRNQHRMPITALFNPSTNWAPDRRVRCIRKRPSGFKNNNRSTYELAFKQRNDSPYQPLLSRKNTSAIGVADREQGPHHLRSHRPQRRGREGRPDDAAHRTTHLRQP